MFWCPHPIGLVMCVNPIMGAYWWSTCIGWACKRAAIRYCDRDGYQTVRAFFIGLIFGEVLIIALDAIFVFLGHPSMGITLNRN